MRSFAPIVAFTIVAISTLAATARADESEPLAPSAQTTSPTSAPARPAGAPLTPPVAARPTLSPSWEEPPTLERPTSLHGYEASRRELKERLRGASKEESAKIRADLKTLSRWYAEDTRKSSSSQFTGGLTLLSIGGAGILGGIGVGVVTAFVAAFDGLLSINPNHRYREGRYQTIFAGCGVAIASGLVIAGIGLPLFLSGNSRVMKKDSHYATTPTLAPSARLLVGPGMVGVGGTF